MYSQRSRLARDTDIDVIADWRRGVGDRRIDSALGGGAPRKSKEVTRSAPYQFTRHPLYLGSSLIGIGFAIAANHLVVAILVVAYLMLTLTAAMRSEEAHLREKFGDAYDAYVEKRSAPMDRPFSWERALHNREHHTLAGLAGAMLILASKLFR